jgi:aminoglycoside N3'-acetyltransferase
MTYGALRWKLFQLARALLTTTAGHSRKTPLHLLEHVSEAGIQQISISRLSILCSEKSWPSVPDLLQRKNNASRVPFACLFTFIFEDLSSPLRDASLIYGFSDVFRHTFKDIDSAVLMRCSIQHPPLYGSPYEKILQSSCSACLLGTQTSTTAI